MNGSDRIENVPMLQVPGECPIPLQEYQHVLLAHGSGGKLTHDLVESLMLPEFDNPILRSLHDGAVLTIGKSGVAFSTDSFVVDPIFFPGGNIGDLAVNGTVNDLAMCGARPLYLSVALIIEEGFPIADLRRIVRSMRNAAAAAGVSVVTGDTKVVQRGKGDKVFITTSGIGQIPAGIEIGTQQVRQGDKILLSGTIADHGMTILCAREGLPLQSELRSDSAPLNRLTEELLRLGNAIHMFRDPTRGGLATALNEIASSTRLEITINEKAIPVGREAGSACEILGLDPLYVANEGKLIVFVANDKANEALHLMQQHPLGSAAAIVGEVSAGGPGTVVLKTRIGTTRTIDLLIAEQLPRIC